jgi:SAM-dependent methyltransferase
MQERFGLALENMTVLDVGAGQRLLQATYFARTNDVVGIDRDVIVEGVDLASYVRMLRSNGLKRVVKTILRKVLRIDARHQRELAQYLGASRFPRPRIYQMDASRLDFPAETFDFVYSLRVFQHLDRPAATAAEIGRVLKPGGVAYVDLTLYTGRTGSLDVRLLGGGQANLPLWAHLRPQHEKSVQQSADLNRLRLAEWREIFEREMPGFDLILRSPEAAWLEPEARRLKARGELVDYDIDELVTTKIIVLWRKPLSKTEAKVSDSVGGAQLGR